MFYAMSDESIWSVLSWLSCVWGLVVLVSYWGGGLSSCLFSMVSYWGRAHSLLFIIIELHNKSFRFLFLCVCIYVVINYQKGGDWKCNHALNHILMLMTTCMLGLIMFIKYISGLCLKGGVWIMTTDIKIYIHISLGAETQDKDKKLRLLVFGFALECRNPALLRGDRWISRKNLLKTTKFPLIPSHKFFL